MSSAKQNWQAKLDFLLAEEPKANDPAQKFKLGKDIEEAKAKLAELELEHIGQSEPIVDHRSETGYGQGRPGRSRRPGGFAGQLYEGEHKARASKADVGLPTSELRHGRLLAIAAASYTPILARGSSPSAIFASSQRACWGRRSPFEVGSGRPVSAEGLNLPTPSTSRLPGVAQHAGRTRGSLPPAAGRGATQIGHP